MKSLIKMRPSRASHYTKKAYIGRNLIKNTPFGVFYTVPQKLPASKTIGCSCYEKNNTKLIQLAVEKYGFSKSIKKREVLDKMLLLTLKRLRKRAAHA